MTPASLGNLVAYSCGLSLIAIGSWVAAASTRLCAPRVRLLQTQLALIAAVLLPCISLLQPATRSDTGLLPMVAAAAGVESAAWSARPALTTAVAGVIVAGMALRFAWLAIGCLRLRRWRLSATPIAPTPEILRLEREAGVRVRWFASNRLTSAATYGLWRPVVLLPGRDLSGSAQTLELIARHELLHVRRRDWLLVVVEECLQAALWFEPAVWLLIDRIRLYREQVVDEEIVQITRQSEIYARALVAGAGLDWILSPRPASHWLRARHLRQRIQAIVNGGTMSRATLVKWTCVFGLTLLATTYSAVQAFPLRGSGASQGDRHVYSTKDPGVVLPTVVREVKPQYTQEAIDAHIEGFVQLAIVIEADGSVSDVRVIESLDPTFGLDDQAVKAAWQWSFKPATKDGQPVAIGVDLQLRFMLK